MTLYERIFFRRLHKPEDGAGSGGGAEPGAGAQPAATGTPTSEPSIQDILSFDPFGPADPGGQKPEGQEPPADGQTGGTGEPPLAAAPGTPTPATPPTAPAAGPSPSNLESLVQQQTAAIRQLAEQRPQAAGAPQAAEQPPAPKFNFGIPPQILNAMSSEDPQERAVGTHALVNGTANAVYTEVEKFVHSTLTDVVQRLPELIQAHMQVVETRRSVYEDFYGKYSMFKNESFMPLVQTTGAQVFQQWAAQGKPLQWSPELRDEIANRLFALFPHLKPADGQQQEPQGQNGASRRFATGSGARPAAAQPGPQDDMMDVLKVF